MQVRVNGEERAVSEGTTVADLLAALGLQGRHLAVEVNREVVPREQYASTTLADGDAVEIVHFVGGG